MNGVAGGKFIGPIEWGMAENLHLPRRASNIAGPGNLAWPQTDEMEKVTPRARTPLYGVAQMRCERCNCPDHQTLGSQWMRVGACPFWGRWHCDPGSSKVRMFMPFREKLLFQTHDTFFASPGTSRNCSLFFVAFWDTSKMARRRLSPTKWR